jgi:hypothetical protein
MNATAPTTGPATIERAVRAARRMYPEARVTVRRGRVIAIEADLIRLISYRRS